MGNSSWVYILSSQKLGTLYIGVTSDLVGRIYMHKEKVVKGFTQKYEVDKLVYFEEYSNIEEAIYREKCIKKWSRDWKIKLIEKTNPEW